MNFRKYRLTLILLVCVVSATLSLAQSETEPIFIPQSEEIPLYTIDADTTSWAYTQSIDTIANNWMGQYAIPGMSIAIMQDGQLLYAKGFGYADVTQGTPATADTIYRLASVSKPVGAVLAMLLAEKGQLDLDVPTRNYVPSLPNHHTHLVWHTITQRSGIGHYNELGSPSTTAHFDTALAALDFFQDKPLQLTPGTGYFYSTHAFTVLGAIIEAAVNNGSIASIVNQQIGEQFNLDTLRVEDRTQANPNRTKLYSWNGSQNIEATPDDLSWKVLGGGLEASAVDMVQFGHMLMDGQILSAESLTKMWTPPDDNSSYAYGWGTGYDTCSTVVAHSGAQLGARSHIIMYPDIDLAIVVLTNRFDGGHDTTDVVRDIKNTILPVACNPALASVSRIAPADGAVISQSSDYTSKFQWEAIDGAAWYHVFVSTADYSQIVLDQWYEASAVCSGSVCTASDEIWLAANGDYKWWMTQWSETVGMSYVDLYNESNFTLALPSPTAITSVTPTGVVSDAATISWGADPGTLWYQVWNGSADYQTVLNFSWFDATQICEGSTCSVNVSNPPSAGDYELWIQSWGPALFADWQKVSSYTITP